MDKHQAIHTISEQTIKAKISGGVTSAGFLATMLAFLSEHQGAITSLSAIAGVLISLIAAGFTVYFMYKSHQMKVAEHLVRMKKLSKK